MVTVPFFSLTRQYQSIRKEINAALIRTAGAGSFILGDNVREFEKEFAGYVGRAYGVGVGSGTDALTMGIRAFGLTSKDEVLVPANSYPTVFGVAQSGVRVRLVDCGWDGNLSVTDLPGRITKRTKAIIVVHLYGNPADMRGVQDVLARMKRTDIKLIEDCAQAHGAYIGHRNVGTFGDIACFSFYPTKNLGAYGDGGMVLTRSRRLAERVRMLRMYGEIHRYKSVEVSGVSRLDELQAAILRVKLSHLDGWNAKRRSIARQYAKKLPLIPFAAGSCNHLVVMRTKERDSLQKYLTGRRVGTAIHYPVPIHLTPAFSSLAYRKGEFPVAEILSREVVSIPVFPELTPAQIGDVVDAITSYRKL